MLASWHNNSLKPTLMNNKSKANIIIHSYSIGSATWSALTSVIPVIGPGLGDSLGLTAITMAMAHSLAALFGKKLNSSIILSLGSLILSSSVGFSSLRAAISVFHGIGSIINAAITFSLQEATGWGLYLFLALGGDLKNISKEDLKAYIARGKVMAKQEQENYKQMLNQLSPDIRDKVEQLQRKLADLHLSDHEREKIIEEIDELFESSLKDVDS
jgi:uncharacterized protein (DUF697 family)